MLSLQGYRRTPTGYCEPENEGLSVAGGVPMLAALSDMMLAMFFPEAMGSPSQQPRAVHWQVQRPSP